MNSDANGDQCSRKNRSKTYENSLKDNFRVPDNVIWNEINSKNVACIRVFA